MNLILLALLIVPDTEITNKKGEKKQGTISKIVIETKSIGKVEVEGNDIVNVAITKHRPLDEEKAKAEVKDLVTKLADTDPDVRETAMQKLKDMGSCVIPLLDEYKDHSDPEAKTRIQTIIGYLQETAKERTIDSVTGKGFHLNGFITQLEFEGKSLDIREIDSIKITGVKESKDPGAVFIFSDNSKIMGKFKNRKLKIKSSDRELEIETSGIDKIELKKIIADKQQYFGTIVSTVEVESKLGKFSIKPHKLIAFDSNSIITYINASGEWSGIAKLDVMGVKQEQKMTVKFKQDGDVVTGEISSPAGGGVGLFKGTVNENTIEGKVKMDDGEMGPGTKYEITLKGKFTDNKFEGLLKVIVGGMAEFHLEAEMQLERKGD